MAQFVKHFVQDLTQDLKVRQCGTIVFNADDNSNVITIDLFNGSEPAVLGGSVVGAVICSDGSTVPVTGGTISGNTVSITLGADCFAIEGPIGVGVQIVNGTQKTTVLKAIYNVEQFTTDNVVDPGSRITITVSDLVSDIEAATAEIPASDMASLMAGIAPTFSTSTNYAAGAYVYYDGTLYKFTQAHSAGSWTGTDAAQAVLANDVSTLNTVVAGISNVFTYIQQDIDDLNTDVDDLKSAFPRFEHPANNIVAELIYTQGGYFEANGTFKADADWGYTDLIPCVAGERYYINTPVNQYIYFYTVGEEFISRASSVYATAPANAAYIRVAIYKTRQSTARLTAGSTYNDYINEIKASLTRMNHPADNIVAELVYTQGGYYNNGGGFNVDANWGYTDLIPVVAGEKYYLNCEVNQYICFYDSNKDFISGVAATSAGAPSTAEFVRISISKARQSEVKLTRGSTYGNLIDALSADVIHKTMTIISDYKVDGNNTPNYCNTVDIDASYETVFTIQNRSATNTTAKVTLTYSGNNVPAFSSGDVTVPAYGEYVWTYQPEARNYGSYELLFSSSFIGFSGISNQADIYITVTQNRNVFVDNLRTKLRMVICDPEITGDGVFSNIQNAIDYLKKNYDVSTVPCTVYLNSGTYTLNYVSTRNAVINKGANRINIIGQSRDEVRLVLTSTPAQNNKIIEHGGPSILKNISFLNLWDDDGSTMSYANNSYCIHNDLGFTSDAEYETVVENCYLYSEAFAPVGAGLHKNQVQRYDNCRVIFNSSDTNPSGYNQWAPIYIHAPNTANDETGCSVIINNCTCIAKKGTKAIVLPFGPSGSGSTTYATIPVTIQRTIGVTNGSSATDVDSRYNLQPESELNNVPAWNYSNYHN